MGTGTLAVRLGGLCSTIISICSFEICHLPFKLVNVTSIAVFIRG